MGFMDFMRALVKYILKCKDGSDEPTTLDDIEDNQSHMRRAYAYGIDRLGLYR